MCDLKRAADRFFFNISDTGEREMVRADEGFAAGDRWPRPDSQSQSRM